MTITVAGPSRPTYKLKPPTWFGIAYLALMVFVALFPGVVTSQDYAKQNLRNRLKPPAWAGDGTWINPLGTDHLGRDNLARLVVGARVTLLIAGGAVLVAGTLGTLAGLISGYLGGTVDEIIMRVADIQLSFPPVLLLVAIMAVIGTSIQNIILVLGFISWVQYARVVRGATLSLKEELYIEAARSIGASAFGIMRRHILPNVFPTLMVITAVNASQQILNEAALSFLGLGVQPPTPAWGSMLSEGQRYFQVAGWNALFPGLAILLIVLGINLVAEELASRR
jgi:peptide/nickel transport system permease protein